MRSYTLFLISLALICALGAIAHAQSNSNQNSAQVREQESSEDQHVAKAVIKSQPQPEYPSAYRNSGFDATVVIKAILRANKKVTNIELIRVEPDNGPEDLVRELVKRSMKAASKIKFTPAMRNGRPVSQYIQIEYRFHLD